jgi:geranylgeranylglycerol-phosphate geranylgeranyltransferase
VETEWFFERIKMQNFSLKNNFFAYLVSMRWYYSFIAAMAGWIGISFSGFNPDVSRQFVVLTVLFIGSGVNQIINDYLGLAEDRYNAPNRPMVTGRLNVKFALVLSFAFFLIALVITYRLNREAIIFYLFVFFLNIVYERAKSMPLLGNILFGLLIAPCVYYAAMCVNQITLQKALLNSRLAALAILVWLINFVLCFFSDFKDYEGDKKAKIKTLVVLLGIDRAKHLGLILIAIPFLSLYYFLRLSLLSENMPQGCILIMFLLSFLCFLYPALLFLKYPHGENTHHAPKWIIMGVVLFKTALIGLVNPYLSIILFIFNFLFMGMLFYLYRDYPA